MNSSKANQPNLQTEKMIFQGRTEQLDWKKIASIDIDTLIHEGDATQLLDLIKPVTFCKADTEFDDGRIRIDPAFIKVFRISQLISEFLLASQEKSIEKLTNLEEKYNETDKEKRKLAEEILHLKEMLTSAKKELKKRKEMLASTQNEMLGENNSDEYDQCPYCAKKFLRPGYLLAHIQRRHQGLPANPLYPSYTPGASTVVCHHPHAPPLLPHNSQQQHGHQQAPHNGIYDSSITVTQTPHGQALLNHSLFPSVHTPSPSILYGSNQQLGPSNLSFSGSVTSLNNIPAHNQGNFTVYNNNAYGLGKRESFTQTAVNEKTSSHLDLLLEEKQNISLENEASQPNQQAPYHSSDNNTPDSLNQLPPASNAANLPLQMETLMRPPLSTPPSPSYLPASLLVDGSRSHPTADVDHGGGDAVAMVGTSTLINRELLEAEKLDVLGMQNSYKTHWGNLEEGKVIRDGREDVKGAMIFETTVTKDPTRFSINAYQSHLKEEGEVTKSPADVINQPQIGGDSQKVGKEFEDLKKMLQASVQGELKSLISRLESQEQFWQDKLGSLQQDHERQIQQLRQELQIKNGATQNNNRTLVGAVAGSENGAVMANDKFHAEREIGDGENADNKVNVDENENNGNVSPPSGIILVESKKNHVIPSSPKNTQFKSTFGAPRHIAEEYGDDDGESVGIPVAKPRKSKAMDMEVVVPVVQESRLYSDTEHMSSAENSPISTKVNVPHRSTTQHPNMHRQHDHSSSVEPLELESYSEETNPEFLTVIQPEEFHEGKHGNSIVPHSSDDVTFAANKERSQRRYQHPLSSHEISPAAKPGLVPEMNKSGSTTRAEKEMTATRRATKQVVKSDEGSDFTLSESVDDDEEHSNGICNTSPQKNDRQHKQRQHNHLGFSDHPGGKSSVKQTPVKKKYIFDANARKLVEVSPEDEEDDENEQSDNNNDLNNASSGDEGGNKRSQSQLDLVRAKTIMELERNIADIGLNPESTAIGMEEMKRALRHLKLKRQDSKDQIHDYDKFDEERNAVKTFAKFEATKSSIDRKLDAISQSSKKSEQSSLKKILTAVKSSGKNFRKRVASAVKKKHKSEQCSDDEENGSEVEKRKRKPSSAPPLKTTFFSKARWTRKKKSDGGITKNSKGKEAATDKKADEMESTSDMSTEESEEEVELPEFMENSNTSFNLRRRGSSSRSRSSERRGNSSHHNSTRSSMQRKGSTSRPKSAKHLKRLNSSASGMQKSPHFNHHQTPSSAVTAAARKSSESSPFSNVDDYDDVDDVYENNKRVEMGDNNSPIRDNGKAEPFGRHSVGTKIQDERQKGNKDLIKQVRTQKPQENTSSYEDDDDDDNYKPSKTSAIEQKTGRLESQVDKNRKGEEDSLSSESQSEDDWDESFATSNEILAKAKSSEVFPLKGSSMNRNNENDSHDFENNDHFERKGISTPQRPSSGNANTVMREGKKWNNEEMSDIRLRQIKQYVSKSKKEVSRDETSFSEEDSQEDFDNVEREVEKGVRQSQYSESKQNPPRQRKIAFSENPTDFSNGKEPASSRNTNPVVQKWATSIIESGQSGQQQLQSTHSNVSSPYNLGRSNQISSYNRDAQTTSNMKVSGFSSGDPQIGFNEGNGKLSFENKQTKGNFDLSKPSWKDTPPHLQQRSQFLTSTPASATSIETNARDIGSLGQNGTASRRQRQHSFDIDEDLRDLLVLSDDDDDVNLTGQEQQKQSDASSNRQNESTDISSFRKKNASAPMLMQPTNHHHLSAGFGGLTNLRSRADAQNKLLQDGNRGSPSSRNSWDSQK